MRRAVLLSLLSLPVLAQTANDERDAYTLRKYLASSQAERESSQQVNDEAMFYLGYVQGIAEALDNQAFCLPSSYRAGELVQVVVGHLDKYPNELHESRGLAVGVALSNAYPCAESKKHKRDK